MLAFCIQLSTQGNSILLVLRVLFALELRHEIRRHSMCKFDHDCLWYIRSLLPCNLTFHPSFNKKSYLTFKLRGWPPRNVNGAPKVQKTTGRERALIGQSLSNAELGRI